jgi:hypothetical protein
LSLVFVVYSQVVVHWMALVLVVLMLVLMLVVLMLVLM